MNRKWALIGTAGLFAADQILKSYAEQELDKKEERKLAGPVVIRRVDNEGLCMGLFSEYGTAVKYLSLAAAGIVTVYQGILLAGRRGFWKKAGSALMSAGAWSNTFDRFMRGHVVDYIGFDVKDKKIAKVTYNLGDFFLAAGALILSVCSVFSPVKKKRTGQKKREAEGQPI